MKKRSTVPLTFAILVIAVTIFSAISPETDASTQTELIYNMHDTYVAEAEPDATHDDSQLKTGKETGNLVEAWFMFDVSEVTAPYLTDAVLWTYVINTPTAQNYNIHNTTETDWTETNLTWNNRPSYGGTEDTNSATSGWINWDITGTYEREHSTGGTDIGYIIEASGTGNFLLDIEDKENTNGTGNVPYLNVTTMTPEVSLASPSDAHSTYGTTIDFQYSTTDAKNITNCSIIFDGAINKTNTSVGTNTSSSFTIEGIDVGDHTWSIRCYDSGRTVYQADSDARDLTILAKVEWHNPSSATPLDIGTALLNAGDPSGTREIYSNNTNENVAVNCESGDCGVIRTNWSSKDMSSTETEVVGFNCSTSTAGSYQADFSVSSDQDGSLDTLTVNCSILAPDLRIISENITFDDDTPTENQEVEITAGIYNDGTYSATDAVVSFYEGHYSEGNQIGEDHTVTISSGSSATVSENWTSKIGDYDIYVVVDPPVDSNGSIDESDETDNYAYKSIDVPMWTVFVGNVTGHLQLATAENDTVLKWRVPDTTDSIIYVTDTDSNLQFSSLTALSRNISGDFMQEDFEELDELLNTSHYQDSVNATFTSGGNPLLTRDMQVFGNTIVDVPMVNTTEYESFVTGILWDSDDDASGNNEYDTTDEEDLVFVTVVNKTKTGMYGTYDYEIKVPSRLKNYKGPNVETVTFYTEIR